MNLALDLSFRAGPDGRTALAGRRVRHPFSVQAPLWDLPGRPLGARIFVQSMSGGIFEGERLGQRVAVQQGAELRVEVPAATVVHEMPNGGASEQRIELVAEAGSVLEFTPPPLILFPDSRLTQTIEVTADAGARLLVGDGFMMHDPGRTGRGFDWCVTTLGLARPDGRLVALDRSRASGTALAADTPGVAGGFLAQGSLLLVRPTSPALAKEWCREIQVLLEGPDVFGGASPLRQEAGLFVRLLARDGGALVQAQAGLVRLMRRMLHDETPVGAAAGSCCSPPSPGPR
ncbi:urease accessory protein UreD [Geminicoccus harenae]|uniref:urease accessory protein UreD n=2 Tax=Geminicoccus harenae TaxID=2498453 RepID=UPI001C9790E6|nr:urease accessory protein UreD [Geminicoccus harenae]